MSCSLIKKRKFKGFTLVELVVISIIAMLLAILMPAMNKARDTGRSVVCKSNMRTLGLSEILFAQENNGKIAWTRYDSVNEISNGSSTIYWAAQLWATYNKVKIPGYMQKRKPYVTPKWLMCPAVTQFIYATTAIDWPTQTVWADVPYGTNLSKDAWLQSICYSRNSYGQMIGWGAKPSNSPQGRLDQIDQPSRQANIADGMYMTFSPYPASCDLYINGSINTDTWFTTRYRHMGKEGINVLLWDGHVESVRKSISQHFSISVKAFSR